MERNRTAIEIMVQGTDENGSDFGNRVDKRLDEISLLHPTGNSICFPTASMNGRLTMVIQCNYHVEIESKAAEHVVNKVMDALGSDDAKLRDELTKQLTEFLS